MSTLEQVDLKLRTVRGPSALGGGWRRLWDLVWLLSVTEFKRTYFGTALGYLWSIGRPLAQFAVLLEVFTHVFRLGSAVTHYPVLLLFNMVIFGFFSEATTTAVTSIVTQEGIVRKTQFPRLVIPLSVVLTALFNLALNFIVVFAFMLGFAIWPSLTWLLLPVVVVLMFVFTTAVSMIVASLYPRFRDISIIWSVFSMALFYATPVLYPLERAPETLRNILLLNPITPLLQLAREWVIDPHATPLVVVAGGHAKLIPAVVIYVGVCIAAVWIFNREAPRIAEEL
jgi:ABC-2 type transport system permease protein